MRGMNCWMDVFLEIFDSEACTLVKQKRAGNNTVFGSLWIASQAGFSA
jgi:hypothetical protein